LVAALKIHTDRRAAPPQALRSNHPRPPPHSWKPLDSNPEKPLKLLKKMGVKQGKIVIDTGRRGDL
jgi:hypothetical protein